MDFFFLLRSHYLTDTEVSEEFRNLTIPDQPAAQTRALPKITGGKRRCDHLSGLSSQLCSPVLIALVGTSFAQSVREDAAVVVRDPSGALINKARVQLATRWKI